MHRTNHEKILFQLSRGAGLTLLCFGMGFATLWQQLEALSQWFGFFWDERSQSHRIPPSGPHSPSRAGGSLPLWESMEAAEEFRRVSAPPAMQGPRHHPWGEFRGVLSWMIPVGPFQLRILPVRPSQIPVWIPVCPPAFPDSPSPHSGSATSRSCCGHAEGTPLSPASPGAASSSAAFSLLSPFSHPNPGGPVIQGGLPDTSDCSRTFPAQGRVGKRGENGDVGQTPSTGDPQIPHPYS